MDSSRVADIIEVFHESPGYLEQTGWLRSMVAGEVVDADGNPLPWLTYPALAFLSERVRQEFAVFEYGSGNSTLWWHQRVQKLVSCEHDKEWFAQYKERVPAEVTYLFRRCKGGSQLYVNEILNYRDMFDILVIDGRQRVRCAGNGIDSLRSGGIIVWDNTDREEYEEGYRFLVESGFRRLDFWGMGPLSTRCWCTSIFYRQVNCFGI